MRVMVLTTWLKLLSSVDLGILFIPLEPPTVSILLTLFGLTEGAGTRNAFLEISWSRSRDLPVSLARYSLSEFLIAGVVVTSSGSIVDSSWDIFIILFLSARFFFRIFSALLSSSELDRFSRNVKALKYLWFSFLTFFSIFLHFIFSSLEFTNAEVETGVDGTRVVREVNPR